jgi:hypothetical protein
MGKHFVERYSFEKGKTCNNFDNWRPEQPNNRVQRDAAGAAGDLGASLATFLCPLLSRSTTLPAARLTRSVVPLDAAIEQQSEPVLSLPPNTLRNRYIGYTKE